MQVPIFEVLSPDQARELRDASRSLNLGARRRALRINAGAAPDLERYESVIARPRGDPGFLWFTALRSGETICALLDELPDGGIDWADDIQYVSGPRSHGFHPSLAWSGSLFSCLICERDEDRRPVILVETILMYKNQDASNWTWASTLTHLANIFREELYVPHHWSIPVHVAYVLNSTHHVHDEMLKYKLISGAVEFCFRALHFNFPDIVCAAVPRMNPARTHFKKNARVPLVVRAIGADRRALGAFARFEPGPHREMFCGRVYVDDKHNRQLLSAVFAHDRDASALFDCAYYPARKEWVPVARTSRPPVSYLELC